MVLYEPFINDVSNLIYAPYKMISKMLLVDIMIRYFAFGFQCFDVYKLLWVWVIVVLLICHLGVRLGWGKR
jgi:hypothetical protein